LLGGSSRGRIQAIKPPSLMGMELMSFVSVGLVTSAETIACTWVGCDQRFAVPNLTSTGTFGAWKPLGIY
jgi:hypothetical protein